MHTLILGLGNPILSDDGVGVRVAEAVGRALPPQAGVTVSEASVGGLELMERLLGYDRVILVDALCSGRQPPGTISRLTLADLRGLGPTQHSASAHDASLVTAWDLAARLALPLPAEVTIYTVEVANVTDFSEEMTPAVAAAVPEVVRVVLEDVRRET